MNILVTGAAGFIGSHLCESLLSSRHEVTGLDNFDNYYKAEIKEQNIRSLNNNPNFKLFRTDIRDPSGLKQIFDNTKFDVVIHLAAKAGVRPSIIAAYEYMDVNIMGLVNLLELAKITEVRRFIFTSSSSVYGNQHKIPFSETDDVSFPISPYAASKRSGELICHSYHHLHGIEIACLRLFTVYGPRQRPDLAIHKFVKLAQQNKPLDLYGVGNTLRDYTFVSDIVDGFVKIVNHSNLQYEIINLGNGQPVSLLEMVHSLEKALGKPLQLRHLDKQAGDVDRTYADIQKAVTGFDYSPKITLDEGVRRFIEWYLANPLHTL